MGNFNRETMENYATFRRHFGHFAVMNDVKFFINRLNRYECEFAFLNLSNDKSTCVKVRFDEIYDIDSAISKVESHVKEKLKLGYVHYDVKTSRLTTDEVNYMRQDVEMLKRLYNNQFGVPKHLDIKKVIFNDPATIVFWKDGTKTVVKCQPGDVFDEEKGLAMAICKKAYGNEGRYYNELKEWLPKEEDATYYDVPYKEYVEKDTRCDLCRYLQECKDKGVVVESTKGMDSRQHFISGMGSICKLDELLQGMVEEVEEVEENG